MNMLTKNYLYTIFYQVFSIIIPIITMPYVTRVLSPNSIGEVNYSQSIAQLFVLSTILGLGKYGVKVIAQEVRGTTDEMKIFIENYIVQIVLGVFSIVIYISLGIIGNNDILYYIQVIYIISAILDINWFYQGREDFKKSITRGIFVKIFGLVLIFLLVNDDSDKLIYALVLSGSQFLGTLFLFVTLFRECSFINNIKKNSIELNNVKKNLLESLKVFIPIFSLQIGMQMYPIIIGILGTKEDVAYFNNSIKIVLIPLYIVTSLSTVLMPRVTKMIANDTEEKIINKLMKQSFNVVICLSIPLSMGIILIAPNFVPWFFGDNFTDATVFLQILAIKIVPMTLIEFIAYQYLLPHGKNTLYAFYTFIGTLIGFILLPPFFSILGVNGIVFMSVLTDILVVILLISKSRFLFMTIIGWDTLKFFVSAITTFAILNMVNFNTITSNSIVITVLEVLMFIIIYLIILLCLKTDFILEGGKKVFRV